MTIRNGKNVYLIDICGTIFYSNTTFDFIRYHYGNKLRVQFWFSWPYRLYNRLIYKLFGKEPLRMNLISILRGIKRDRLLEMANDFYSGYLETRKNKQVLDIINQWRNSANTLVIVSATIDVIAQVVGSHLGIDNVLSTKLHYLDNGECEGKIERDLLSRKKQALSEVGYGPPYGGIITDNYSDVDLIVNSKKSYLVTYNNSKKWKEILNTKKIQNCILLYV